MNKNLNKSITKLRSDMALNIKKLLLMTKNDEVVNSQIKIIVAKHQKQGSLGGFFDSISNFGSELLDIGGNVLKSKQLAKDDKARVNNQLRIIDAQNAQLDRQLSLRERLTAVTTPSKATANFLDKNKVMLGGAAALTGLLIYMRLK